MDTLNNLTQELMNTCPRIPLLRRVRIPALHQEGGQADGLDFDFALALRVCSHVFHTCALTNGGSISLMQIGNRFRCYPTPAQERILLQ